MKNKKNRKYAMRFSPFFLFIIFVLTVHVGSSQIIVADSENEYLAEQMSELKLLCDTMLYSRNEGSRFKANAKFIRKFVLYLQHGNSFEENFEQLKTLSIVKPDNNKFRIITWSIATNKGYYRFYGTIQYNTENLKLRPMVDKTKDFLRNKKLENYTLGVKTWYGVKYKEIMTIKNNEQEYYVMTGWKGISFETTQKVIETLYFDEKNEPRFGIAVFSKEAEIQTPKNNRNNQRLPKQVKQTFKKRVIFEYKQDLYMMLKINKEQQSILFDHLVPPAAGMEGIYKFYGPDLTYDGYFLQENKKWILRENLDLKNKPTGKAFNNPLNNQTVIDE